MVSPILRLKETMKKSKTEFKYENRVGLYLLGKPQDEFKNLEYYSMTSMEWFRLYGQKEIDAIKWVESKGNDIYGKQVLRDLINIQSLGLPEKINVRIEKLMMSKTFIAVETRVQLDYENNILDQAVVNAILFDWVEGGIILIHYITRFFQGIIFQFRVEKKEPERYERFAVDKLFSFVMQQVKKIPNTFTIKIQLVSEGSKKLIEKHLLTTYFEKNIYKLPVVHDTDYQYFPVEYLQFQLCCQCMNNISFLKWEKQNKYSFCSIKCAQNKWESF
jgi:hypothetical protein